MAIKKDPLDWPCTEQEYDNWCGPQDWEDVFAGWDYVVTADEFANYCNTRNTGTNCANMGPGARFAGFWAYQTFKGTFDEVKDFVERKKMPVIVYMYNRKWG